jgi:hypothetical protein
MYKMLTWIDIIIFLSYFYTEYFSISSFNIKFIENRVSLFFLFVFYENGLTSQPELRVYYVNLDLVENLFFVIFQKKNYFNL